MVVRRRNNPNAGILMQSLRYLGYNNNSAALDIIDNSLDAGATVIRIYINQVGGDPVIKIIDNGSGMDISTLDQALRLGSEADRNIASDLGKFGMGLCTASISIARYLEVITKTTDGSVLKSIQDIDEIIQENDFVKYLEEGTRRDIEKFKEYLPENNSGTIVTLRKCDNLKNQNLTRFKNKLKEEIGRTFRAFIAKGIKFYLNDEEVSIVDPLLVEESEIYSDDEFTLHYKKDGTAKSEKVRIRLSIIPDNGEISDKSLGSSMSKSGFYVMRNDREIENAKTLGMFTKHPVFNRFRGEIWFSADMDEAMGVDFRKKGLDLTEDVYVQIYKHVKPQLRAIRIKLKNKITEESEGYVSHDESAKIISQKSKYLTKPDAVKETRGPRTRTGNPPTPRTTTDTPRPRVPRTRTQASDVKVDCRFDTVKMSAWGPIYNTFMEGKTLVVQWNIDHPFYEKFVLANKDNKGSINTINFLIYSLASAELKALNEENEEILDNIKTIMSSNMRVLLS